MTTIIGLKLGDRCNNSCDLQGILTEFGCSIRTRLGLHPITSECCYPYGIILLEVVDDVKAKELEVKLCEIENIEIQRMIFS